MQNSEKELQEENSAKIENNDIQSIKLILEYDGTEFSGWQVQPNRRTVQGELKDVLKSMLKEEVNIVGSGRTDAGVHALGQVASFRTTSRLPLSAFRNGINTLLPDDVRILHAEETAETFNARRDAVRRTYRYVLSRRPRVLGRRYTWYPHCEFQLGPMKSASQYLIGEHDFLSFCKNSDEIEDHTSRIIDIGWEENDDEVWFTISATRFFHNMVRIIVGTLIEVGKGKMSPKEFRRILEARDRSRAGATAPPHGLVLVKVDY